jgi:hypothetical protein
MELKAYFSNIDSVIASYLEQATSEIIVAVAWFTDRNLFEVLCNKAKYGITVSIVLIDDDINKGQYGLDFSQLISLGGSIFFLPQDEQSNSIMHHKFCVIDNQTVITGSFNWSKRARRNDENITVVENDVRFACDFTDAFTDIVTRIKGKTRQLVDIGAVRKRLELIRNFILLGEHDEIKKHSLKLLPASQNLHLSPILSSLDKGEFKAALQEIDDYLKSATSLISLDNIIIPQLQFELKINELRLESLVEAKAELDRQLIIFNRQHDDALGEIITEVLNAKAQLMRLIAESSTEQLGRSKAEDEARQAYEDYKEYSKNHEELQQSLPIPKLNKASVNELKRLFKKSCNLCHPDKVSKEFKDKAHEYFVQLLNAYKSNDLALVKELYQSLKAGNAFIPRSSCLSVVDTLKATISELEHTIVNVLNEFNTLQISDSVILMKRAGDNDEDWALFFTEQRKQYEYFLSTLKKQIAEQRSMVKTYG